MIEGTPIVYEGTVETRFSDLDLYGHVNGSCYIDYVATMRFTFAEQKLGLSLSEFTRRGLGFFLARASIRYRKAISGLQPISISSYVEKTRGSLLVIPFEIRSTDKQTLYADGELRYAMVDLKTQSPISMPQWAIPYFWR